MQRGGYRQSLKYQCAADTSLGASEDPYMQRLCSSSPATKVHKELEKAAEVECVVFGKCSFKVINWLSDL